MNLGNKVVYQIYPKSFQDSNGDGLGDWQGSSAGWITWQSWEADYLWIRPFLYPPSMITGTT